MRTTLPSVKPRGYSKAKSAAKATSRQPRRSPSAAHKKIDTTLFWIITFIALALVVSIH